MFLGLAQGVLFFSSSSKHSFDGVSWQRVKEKNKEDDECQPEEDLDDGPLVVVPDDVTD